MRDVLKPIILVDEHKTRQNITRMALKAARNKVRFRPHFKTHQSAHIGEWFRGIGVNAITVSSVSMAKYFADNGWEDITIAFPVNLLEMEGIQELATRVSLGLLVDSIDVARKLALTLLHRVEIWLAVNTGLDREGISVEDLDQFVQLINAIRQSPYLELVGCLTHFGQTYAVQGKASVSQIYQTQVARLRILKKELYSRAGVALEISIGDTPSCSLVDNISEVDEIRPGNFVFYDLHQLQIGSCEVADIAAGVACPVVSVYPDRQTVLIYGGAVHLSKDYILGPNGKRTFGKVALLNERGWDNFLPDTTVYSISQEHGLIRTSRSRCEQIQPGDILIVFPSHICLTVSALHRYRTLENQALDCFVE